MRIYKNAYELISEIYRDVWEMGVEIQTDTMQNLDIRGNPDYLTKEILNYSYCLRSIEKAEYLFLVDNRMLAYAKQELRDRLHALWENPGHSYKIRKDVWEPFLNKYGRFDYTYNERIRKQLEIVIEELMMRPNTRQAIISIWDPTIDVHNLGGLKRVPCSMYYQFIIRDGKLDVIYNMRSCDVMTHFGVDVWLAYMLMVEISTYLPPTISPGVLYHNIASLHCYQKDWANLKECIDDLNKKG